jgi:Tfp pilus assembly protein PilN
MPIRINLLAEAQAAEDLRRRDPVKRVLWIGACLVAAILAWASTLQARIVLRSTQLDTLEGKIKDLEGEYAGVVASQKALASARQNLNALERLRTNRFLTGNLLDTLQKVYVDDVRVVKLKTEFAYQKTAATSAKTNALLSRRAPRKPPRNASRCKSKRSTLPAQPATTSMLIRRLRQPSPVSIHHSTGRRARSD